MNTKPITLLKLDIIEELVRNLNTLRPDVKWSRYHPLIQQFETELNKPFRRYHQWKLISFMLEELSKIPHTQIKSVMRLCAAIIFQDIIHVPGSRNNKRDSALYASQFYQGNNLAEITSLIEASQITFPFEPCGDDRDIIRDLNLLNLAGTQENFISCYADVSAEYVNTGTCTQSQFQERADYFLNLLLRQSKSTGLFRTRYCKENYESVACHNLDIFFGITS
jgi:predicted metal-dependent HD superfamily phosphohydrolase